MLRCSTLAVILTGAALVGCGGAGHDGSAKTTADALTPTELAAYAASHKIPTTPATDELRVAALISADRSTIRLYNFTSSPLAEIDVWVNGAWLQHVRGIGANNSVMVKTTDLYNAFGKNFASQSEPVTRVQLHIGGKFYNAMGPVTQ